MFAITKVLTIFLAKSVGCLDVIVSGEEELESILYEHWKSGVSFRDDFKTEQSTGINCSFAKQNMFRLHL